MLRELGQIPGGMACLRSTVSRGTLEILGICSVTGNAVLAGGDLNGWDHLEDSWTGWLEAGLSWNRHLEHLPVPTPPPRGWGLLTPWQLQGLRWLSRQLRALKIKQTLYGLLWPIHFRCTLLVRKPQAHLDSQGGVVELQLLMRGVSKNLWPCLKTTLTLKQVNQLALSHLHQLTTGFPKAEPEKWSLKQGKICLGRLVTSATGVCDWERQVWANTAPVPCPELQKTHQVSSQVNTLRYYIPSLGPYNTDHKP